MEQGTCYSVIILMLLAWAGPLWAQKQLQPQEASVPQMTCCVRDALGNPIASARVVVSAGQGQAAPVTIGSYTSDGQGLISFPHNSRQGQLSGHCEHPDYGVAEAAIETAGRDLPQLQLPVVKQDSPAYERALKGIVNTPDGKPLANTLVSCSIVRTPGEGLIASHNRSCVRTDAQGRFAIYVPDVHAGKERGQLIPLRSRFSVVVQVSPELDLFPYGQDHLNTEPTVIKLERPKNSHQLVYESPDGVHLTEEQVAARVTLSYRKAPGGPEIPLPARYLNGGLMADGIYEARFGSISYEALDIKPDSPESLVFLLPPQITFRGRVVHGVTSKPMAGAFVIGMTGIADDDLATLDDAAWEQLHALPAKPDMQSPVLQRIERMYSFGAVARTDEAGNYELVQPLEKPFYGIIVFEKDFLPFQQRLAKITPDAGSGAQIADVPLFPAARVMVRPVFKGGHPAISPKWLPEEGEQPAWYRRFKAADDRNERTFAYVHWMKLNDSRPIFVPADVRLKLKFETPYDDQWQADEVPQVLQLAQGQTKDLGGLAILESLAVVVRVVDPDGKGVEGIPIRRMYDGSERVWSLAHNTDAEGVARFHVQHNSTGRFGAEIPGTDRQTLGVRFTIGQEKEIKEPFTITLTAQQVQNLVKSKGR